MYPLRRNETSLQCSGRLVTLHPRSLRLVAMHLVDATLVMPVRSGSAGDGGGHLPAYLKFIVNAWHAGPCPAS